MMRVGMLTSGGDCQALNATMHAFDMRREENRR